MKLDTEQLLSELWQRIAPKLTTAAPDELRELVESTTRDVCKQYVAFIARRQPQDDAELDAVHNEFFELLDRTLI